VAEPPSRIFVETLVHYRAKGIYKLHAFVVMPDHIHVLLTPASDVTLERAVQHIKGGSARRLGEELLLRFPVWQKGFTDHRIRDRADFQVHVRYIEQNPVKLRLVEAAVDYVWSSASGGRALDSMPNTPSSI
jgi:putative transposase